jgi:hypothetical protein
MCISVLRDKSLQTVGQFTIELPHAMTKSYWICHFVSHPFGIFIRSEEWSSHVLPNIPLFELNLHALLLREGSMFILWVYI